MTFLRRVSRVAENELDELAVLVEPKPGHSDEEVVQHLRDAGATALTVIAPGFVSAVADRRACDSISRIAFVHVEESKEPRLA
jgi:hypothetical protein